MTHKFLFFYCILVLFAAEALAQGTWPGESIWPTNQTGASNQDSYAYKDISGNPVRDANGNQNPNSTDVSSHGATTPGDWNSAYFYADSTYLYFRLLVNQNPTGSGGTGFVPFAWLVEIDVDGDNYTDWYVGINGITEVVSIKCKTTGITDTSRSTATWARIVDSGVASLAGTGNMFYVDWQVPLTALSDGVGGCADITSTTLIRVFFGSSASGVEINKDFFTGTSVDYTTLSYVSVTNPGGTGPNAVEIP